MKKQSIILIIIFVAISLCYYLRIIDLSGFLIILIFFAISLYGSIIGRRISHLPAKSTKATILSKNTVIKQTDDRKEILYQISFLTENNTPLTFNFSKAVYDAFLEGDYGILTFKQTKSGKIYYQNFHRNHENSYSNYEYATPKNINCPNCGASVKFNRDIGKGICEFCQTEVFLPKSEADIEYEKKFALAQNMEKIYFMSGHNAVQKNGKNGFDAVLEYYGEAELAGGEIKEEYWIAIARFYVKGALFGFENGSVKLNNRQEFINSYILFMDNAIRYSQNSKKELEDEKQKNIENLNVELQKYREVKKHGCYIATCVYGRYDCPQVWILRKFRDEHLEKSFFGRLFIKIYYFISPKLVKVFGKTKCFHIFFQYILDKIIKKLQSSSINNGSYSDKK